MQWNLTQDGGLWIMAPESVAQIGCIHTCQGLEVDYIGVIVGPDLVVRDGQGGDASREAVEAGPVDQGIQEVLKTDPEGAKKKADLIIKNTYRTLMTRGMKGCYVYCTDRGDGGVVQGEVGGGQRVKRGHESVQRS